MIEMFGRSNIKGLKTHKNPGLEVVYLAKGRVKWHVEGRIEVLEPHSIFFTLPWEAHGSIEELEPGNDTYWSIFKIQGNLEKPRKQFNFHKNFGLSSLESNTLSKILTSQLRRSYPASSELAWLMMRLIKECYNNIELKESFVASYSRTIFLELARLIVFPSVRPEADPSTKKVSSFINSLSANSGEDWTLESMANECHMGRTHFSNILKKLTGENPLYYLNRVRIEQAKAKLLNSKKSITDIAYESGFSTSQYFVKVFRKFSSMNPSMFRNRFS